MTTHQERLRIAVSNRSKGGFRVAAKDESTSAEIYLYEEIDALDFCGVSAKTFTEQLRAIEADEITLHLNSPGGDAFEGIAIMNALRQHKARVVVVVDGLAASAASFIAMAGDEVLMSLGSQMMIHDAWGVGVGNADDFRDLTARLDSLSDDLAEVYAEHAGGTPAEWRAAMQAETWYGAHEAVEAGLADRVETKRGNESAEKAMARYDLSLFAHAGREHAPAPFIPAARAALRPPSAEPVASNTPNRPQEVTVSADTTLRDGVLARLGVTDTTADDATIFAALDEVLAEQAEQPAAATVVINQAPEGTVNVSEGVFAQLQADAARGVEAHKRQVRDDRERALTEAVANTQITPHERESWQTRLQNLEKYPEAYTEALATLQGLPKGLIPTTPIGHDVQASLTDYPVELLPTNHPARAGHSE